LFSLECMKDDAFQQISLSSAVAFKTFRIRRSMRMPV
jgi:hypothetical protein